MNLYVQRRIIAAVALLGFVFAVAFPALAVARIAVDPTAYAAICRIDTGSAAGERSSGLPGSLQGKLKTAHCVMCTGTASPPPAVTMAPIVIAAAPELLLPVDDVRDAPRDADALQPLQPRAPPRA